MASSSASLVHLLLLIRRLHMLTLLYFLTCHCPKDGGTFLFVLTWLVLQSTLPFTRHIQHDDLDPPGPNLQHVEGVIYVLIKGTNLIFLYFAQL
jgi:hypothetical protein